MIDARTVARLPRRWLVLCAGLALLCAALLGAVACPAPAGAAPIPVPNFGANPGNLTMYSYRPAELPAGRPVVVALHGCSQTAGHYFDHAGWQKYADLWRFTVVLPEQKAANNSSSCFNWFEAGDIARGRGEALSIRNMARHAVTAYDADPGGVYVTGLSAGGAMAGVMLAAYPDVFAAGAVIAGLAYRCATDLPSALTCMNSPPNRTPRQWGDLVRDAYPGYHGPYPRVAIWHGAADTTVVPANADRQRDQWTDVWGIGQTPTSTGSLPGGVTVQDYADGTGTPAVRLYHVSGVGHGTPVDPGANPNECGMTAQYFPDSVCSTYYIARAWGLSQDGPPPGGPPAPTPSATVTAAPSAAPPVCVTANNYEHTTAGRAYTRTGRTYARGSNEDMGPWTVAITHTLRRTGPEHWVLADGRC
jgi:poly(hydroxyalkanoate) depolymerase family esterase